MIFNSLSLPFRHVLNGFALITSFFWKHDNTWIFLDRDSHADDNAEHLYRYVREKYPELNIYFLLRKKSHDWARLKKDGFRLIPFGSLRHMLLMFRAKHLVSSHADNYVFNFPPQNWFGKLLKYHYTFLQHGVIKDDLSSWLNKKPIDLFITTTEQEYNSIAREDSNYKFTSKEVRLTGLARHDELLEKAQSHTKSNGKKTLLIMPTWRQNLVGKTEWMSNNRSENDAFYSSQYAQSWKQFLHSDSLKELVSTHDLNVVFFPHANMAPYLGWFDAPSYIHSVTHHAGKSIQDFFVEASMMLTDYSSVAFEIAFLEKPVMYYQFDSEQVFGGEHLTEKGYFDYHKDGFGPVCETEKGTLLELEKILNNNCELEDKYLSRATKTFKFKDGKCCQRIYEAILDLDKPDENL
ncbi:CDP-glycerol glycerophosphotransferase family protein [Candidatus Gracilibacteria bacterium]|nr:CDP-glycerol glycerophosphotransferase family protein [Candidatus Gracilibacteria bacterium]